MGFRQTGVARAMPVLGFVCLFGSVAFASLGSDITSIEADQAHMQASRKILTAAQYTAHEIQSANGMLVREYVSPAGRVFAVTWRGPWMPDMHQLLGEYFDQYTQARQVQSQMHAGRGPVRIEQPGLVVELAGHPRSFVGRAYLPDQMPAGVQVEDLK